MPKQYKELSCLWNAISCKSTAPPDHKTTNYNLCFSLEWFSNHVDAVEPFSDISCCKEDISYSSRHEEIHFVALHFSRKPGHRMFDVLKMTTRHTLYFICSGLHGSMGSISNGKWLLVEKLQHEVEVVKLKKASLQSKGSINHIIHANISRGAAFLSCSTKKIWYVAQMICSIACREMTAV